MKTKFKFGRACYWSGWVIPAVAWLGLILALMFVGGCAVYGGASLKYGSPNQTLENPIGIIGAELQPWEGGALFIEHQSGILDSKDRMGFNSVGIRQKIQVIK